MGSLCSKSKSKPTEAVFEEKEGPKPAFKIQINGNDIQLGSDEYYKSTKLLPYEYMDGKAWNQSEMNGKLNGDNDGLNVNSLKIMSFNVWFSNYKWKERLNELCKLIKEHNVDIFCLQEVTTQFLWTFGEYKYIQDTYVLTDVTGDTLDAYGVIIGCNKQKMKMMELKITQLPTHMRRSLLSVKMGLYNSNNDEIWINTVHLESKNNTSTRIKQMNIIFGNVMNKMNNCILTGDFNFKDSNDNDIDGKIIENDKIPDNYMDCWKKYCDLKCQNDTSEWNKLFVSGWTRRVGYRYDRILLKSDIWNVSDFKIIGRNKSNSNDDMPSDHLGVITDIKRISVND